MMNTYVIVVSKKSKTTPEVADYLRSIFTHTWRLAANKDNETWMCGRAHTVDISDMMTAIKSLNKNIDGVFVQRVMIYEAGYDKKGKFDEKGDGDKCPGTARLMDVFMNKI